LNDLLYNLGIEWLKPVLTALVLPPVVWLWPLLLGAVGLWRRRAWGWVLTLFGMAGLWLGSTVWAGAVLTQLLTQPPPHLSEARIASLARQPGTAIVVLGAGRYARAPDYGVAAPKPLSLERLRYGLWLSRRTGLPVAYTGGIGHGAEPGATEAEVADRVARSDFNRPLRWLEDRSRDTRENARLTVQLLGGENIQRMVLVTHAAHMRRTLRAFEEAARLQGKTVEFVPAPVGSAGRGRSFAADDLLPSGEGVMAVRYAVREWLGWLAGA
jgi:uncharacterized SAM-binding protein YcdF (DUF218 family)